MTRCAPQRTRKGQPRRAGVFVLSAVLLSLLLRASETAHFLLVQHSICQEHGELLHVDDADHHAHEAGAAPDLVPTLRDASAEHRGHEHDHCTWFSEHREALVADRACVAPAEPLLPARMPTWTYETSRLCTIPLLLLALKGSPPA
jgi:hypothetical protein